jgi:hypothetical protein
MIGSGAVYFFAPFAGGLKLLTAKAGKKFRKVREEEPALRNCTTTRKYKELETKVKVMSEKLSRRWRGSA